MNNELAQWLSVYDQNMPRRGSNNYAAGASPWGTLANQDSHDSDRLFWAMNAMRQGGQNDAPNFFANLPEYKAPAYQAPQQFNETRPQMQMPRDSMRGPANNYLMQLLGGR
jgi:hypothetical protein